jgi:hypothetical protein
MRTPDQIRRTAAKGIKNNTASARLLVMTANTRIKPTRVVEAEAWQAFSATLMLERSKFGLNELLGRNCL